MGEFIQTNTWKKCGLQPPRVVHLSAHQPPAFQQCPHQGFPTARQDFHRPQWPHRHPGLRSMALSLSGPRPRPLAPGLGPGPRPRLLALALAMASPGRPDPRHPYSGTLAAGPPGIPEPWQPSGPLLRPQGRPGPLQGPQGWPAMTYHYFTQGPRPSQIRQAIFPLWRPQGRLKIIRHFTICLSRPRPGGQARLLAR